MSDGDEPRGNAFEKEPCGSPDEDGERAYVDVTATTATGERAVDWIATEGAEELLSVYQGSEREVDRSGIRLRRLTVRLPTGGRLPERVNVAQMIRDGSATAWWEFDVSGGWVEDGDSEMRWRVRAQDAEDRNAEARRRAVDDRGWWGWRLRCWAARRLLALGGRVDPPDRTIVQWSVLSAGRRDGALDFEREYVTAQARQRPTGKAPDGE